MTDFWSFRRADPVGRSDINRTLINVAIDRQRDEGATWVRVTVVDAKHQPLRADGEAYGFWIEGWRVRPSDEGPFDPPLTHASEEQVSESE